jgi:polysaccharide export outer membrane protein
VPRAVTSLSEVRQSAEQGAITLVPITAATLPPPPQPLEGTFPASFTGVDDYAYDVLGPGDRVHVRIFESGTPAVFSGPGGVADLGEMAVDESGNIYIPYAGAVRAAGRTAPEVRRAIMGALSRVVLRPQVDVRVVEKRSNLVSVLGSAAKPGSYPIQRGRTQLGELLAEVAPDQENPEMLAVTLRRDGESATVRLADVYSNPALNVALQPGDSVILQEVVQNLTVLGAAGAQGQVRIPERDFSLLDAIGEARGLSGDDADPRAVFLLRPQPPGTPAVVYQVDMRQPESVALASQFVVADGDAILISSAPFAQTRKVLSAFSQTLGTLRAVTPVVR